MWKIGLEAKLKYKIKPHIPKTLYIPMEHLLWHLIIAPLF